MEMRRETEGERIDGFIQGKTQLDVFPVTREIQMKLFHHNGKCYVRTRDAASLLGIKQPFQFVACCKEFLGENAILKGTDTESFRDGEDSSRVTFIEISDLLDYLLSDKTRYLQKFEGGMYMRVIKGLQSLLK